LQRSVLSNRTIIRLLSGLVLVGAVAFAQDPESKIIGTWCGADGNAGTPAYMCLNVYQSDGLVVEYMPTQDSPSQSCLYTQEDPDDHFETYCPKYHIGDAFYDGKNLEAIWEEYPTTDANAKGTAYLAKQIKP